MPLYRPQTVTGAPGAIFQPRSGIVYAPYINSAANGNNPGGNGLLSGCPIEFASPFTLNALMTSIAVVGSAGAVYRMGIYRSAAARPSTLVLDGGTVDATTGGDKTLTVNVTAPAGMYWFMGVSQGAPTTPPNPRSANTIATASVLMDGWLSSGTTPFPSGTLGYSTTGITAALPADLSGAVWTGQTKPYIVFPRVA